jgi:hypothetical protein
MSRTLTVFIFILLSAISARAQGPVLKPGDEIRLSVTFSGKDAGKITDAGGTIGTADQTHPDQPNFSASFSASSSHATGPNTFEMIFKIPENARSGTYKLLSIDVGVAKLGIGFHYNSPADFEARTYKVENPATIEKPSIKDVH